MQTSVFDCLVDQKNTVNTLKGAVAAARSDKKSQEMTHAWVFTGPPGSGRSLAATAFAQALICSNSGCGNCSDCDAVASHVHPDVEVIRTEGLSITIEEVRELQGRSAWVPSIADRRVVIIEDGDRLTEAAANALLKAIEEPGVRSVWLLCAPSLDDVLPTIRSRCRHIQLRTPNLDAVINVLHAQNNLSISQANFIARVSQGHIGRANYLASNITLLKNRETVMKSLLQIGSPAAAFYAAQTLVELTTTEVNALTDEHDAREIEKLKLAYKKEGTGQVLASGGVNAIKELNKLQKARLTRKVRDTLDRALLDIASFYRDVMMFQAGYFDSIMNSDMLESIESYAANSSPQSVVNKIEVIMEARINLGRSAAPLVTCEALMCDLAKQ